MDRVQLTATVDLTAADPAADAPAKVFINAYNGDIMRVAGQGLIVLDLAGMALPPRVTLLVDHLADMRGVVGVGVARIVAGTLEISGTISRATPNGQTVIALAKDEVPLQASVGADILESRYVKAGESVNVNGRSIPGPFLLISKSLLKEVSVTPLGADSTTSVHIAARNHMNEQETATETATENGPPDALAVERVRTAEILTACAEYPEIAATAIRDAWTVDQARAAAVARLRGDRPSVSGVNRGGSGPAGNPRDSLACAGLLMAGEDAIAAKHFGERVVGSVRRPHSWADLCATALRSEGHDVPNDRHELIRAGFSTTSLPTALGVGIQKVVLETFMDMSENWRALCRPVSARDFKTGSALRLSAASKLERVGPDGAIKHGDLSEDAFSFKVGTFAKQFVLTRQAIINDDASVLSDIPRVLGAEAARTTSDLVFSVLVGNAASFFSSDHENLLTEALDLASLSEAITILRTRTDRDNRIIGLTPATLVVPAALEAPARALLSSTYLYRDLSVDSQPSANPLPQLALVVEPRLDAASKTDWYLFARASDSAMLIAFLDGVQSPRVETTDPGPDYLGAGWRAWMDVDVALAEYRAAVKSDVTPYA